MEWCEETILRLRSLWSEGHSTAEIGRRLGVSKNAVVGKAHRLDLPARPSPIRRDGPANPRPAVRRVAGPTLPPLPSAATARPATQVAAASPAPRAEPPRPLPGPAIIRPALGPAPRPVAPPPPPPAPRLQSVPPRPFGRVVACCWPIGEPGTKSFRFCDDSSVPGKPYCAEHAQLAYVKVRDRREDAA